MLNDEPAAVRRDTALQHERADGAERNVNEQAIRLVALTTELAGARQSHLEQVEQFTAQLAARPDTAAQQLRAEHAERNLGEAAVRAATLTAELGSAQQRLADERIHTETRLADQRVPSRTASPSCGRKWSNSGQMNSGAPPPRRQHRW